MYLWGQCSCTVGNLVSRPFPVLPQPNPNVDPQNMQGYHRGLLNTYYQNGILTEIKYFEEVAQECAYKCSVQVYGVPSESICQCKCHYYMATAMTISF